MLKAHNRVGEDHSRANGSHDLPDFFTHGWFVTVHFAFSTACLAFLKRTMLKALVAVFKKFRALVTQRIMALVFELTILSYHCFNSMCFTEHSA